jgi:hypothetical protein
MTPRTDQRTAALISLALFYRHMLGLPAAAALLARHCVPLRMARRVLTTTRSRRAPPLIDDEPAFS